jgi:diphthamide synthase (EF-2-diphthine--ammonia ligase)
MACINLEQKKNIDFASRQVWLNEFMAENRTHSKYDCAVAVSGGKDSHMIVKRLYDNHNLKNILLISLSDEFTPSMAGRHNRDNISRHFGLDHIVLRSNPREFVQRTLEGFEKSLNPLGWFEERIYKTPIDIARSLGIPVIFFGENPTFEYGESEELDVFHPLSTDELKVVYLGGIYPYSISDSLEVAKSAGFKDLSNFPDWRRVGNIEEYSQIDSLGYMVHIWCKFPKFGFQRVSDIACRFVREGLLTKAQAELLIRERDHILDGGAKRDFCQILNISEKYFDKTVDRHANPALVEKDVNGMYKRKAF